MCGIFFSDIGPYGIYNNIKSFFDIRHRGPDGSKILEYKKKLFCFHRLAIINPDAGINQPFEINSTITLCNGEIYNWKKLCKQYNISVESDCEIIPHLYEKCERNFINMVKLLDGEFAIILYDMKSDLVYAARDFMGIRPLYHSISHLSIASELKGLTGPCNHIIPRYVYTFKPGNNIVTNMIPYWGENVWPHKLVCTTLPAIPSLEENILDEMYFYLYASVKDRMETNRPIGCFLSGGLDSSIISSIACRIKPGIDCFVIGGKGSKDVNAAQKVAKRIGAQLHIVEFDMKAAYLKIEEVIKTIETYDITTIRASIPQYILAKYISSATDIKVVLSGEGSDELFGGYIYSKLAPSPDALKEDRMRLLNELYLYDCLRTDRTTAAWGLEVRVPFLQKDFVERVLNYPTHYFTSGKDKLEKYLLRKMAMRFNLLPEDICMRGKEAFSDAVSNDTILWKDFINKELESKAEIYKTWGVKPESELKHELELYKQIFCKYYPDNINILPKYWMPKWCNVQDPSATVLPVYNS